MMRLLTLLMILGIAPALAADQCALCGAWRSHEQRTLEEVSRSTLITSQQRELFEDDYFGRLIVEIRPGQGRSYFHDEDPATVPWERHVFAELSPGVHSSTSQVAGQEQTRIVRIRGDCFVVEQPEYEFGEWFCRVAE